MRRYFLTAAILALLITPITAKQVANNWVFYDGSLTVDGEEASLIQAGSTNGARVSYHGQNTYVTYDECSSIGKYRFCYENKSEDKKPGVDSEGNVRPGMRFTVHKEDDDQSKDTVSLGVTVDTEDNQRVGNEYDATITFSNTGEAALFSFVGDITPKGMNYSLEDPDRDDVLIVGDNNYRLDTTLGENENTSLTIEYEPTSLNPLFRIAAEYGADSADKSFEENQSVPLSTPYDVDVSVPDSTTLFDEATINVSITNQADTDVNATTTVEQDRNQVLRSDTLRQSEDGLRVSERLRTNQTTTYQVTLQPRYTGTTNITVDTRLRYDDLTTTVTNTETVKTPEPRLTYNVSGTTTTSGGEAPLPVTIANNEPYRVYNGRIQARTSLGNDVWNVFTNLSRDETIHRNLTYDVPNGVKPQSYDVDLALKYRSNADELFTQDARRQITVERQSYEVLIDKRFDDTEPNISDTVKVTVYVENLGSNRLDGITFYEATQPTRTGLPNATVTLDSQDRIELYNYSLAYNGTPITTTTITEDNRVSRKEAITLRGETRQNVQDPPTNTSTDNQTRNNRSGQSAEPEPADQTLVEQIQSLARQVAHGIASMF